MTIETEEQILLKDKDLEKLGIMKRIENKLYPFSPNQVERKIRRAIVLAFNEGIRWKKVKIK